MRYTCILLIAQIKFVKSFFYRQNLRYVLCIFFYLFSFLTYFYVCNSFNFIENIYKVGLSKPSRENKASCQ